MRATKRAKRPKGIANNATFEATSSTLVISGSGNPMLDGEWVRREDPEHVRRIDFEQASKLTVADAIEMARAGSRPKTIVEFKIETFADFADLVGMVSAWAWAWSPRRNRLPKVAP